MTETGAVLRVLPPPGSIDAGVPWHFGSPLTEQRALDEGAARVDLSHRAVVRVGGADRLSWLHTLTTQHLTNLTGGDSRLALILDRNGRVEHELHLIEGSGETWLIGEAGSRDALIAYLDSMRFWSDVDVSDATADWAAVGSNASHEIPGTLSWEVPMPFRERFPMRESVVPREALGEVLAAAPRRAGTWAWEALRVAAAMPRLPPDTDSRTIPHEVGWIGSAVHLQKGCYRGQETVARVQNLGRPPRRLVLLHLDGTLPGPGAPVRLGDRQVGVVGSTAQHWELGPIALASVKRQVPLGATLVVDVGDVAVAASQECVNGD